MPAPPGVSMRTCVRDLARLDPRSVPTSPRRRSSQQDPRPRHRTPEGHPRRRSRSRRAPGQQGRPPLRRRREAMASAVRRGRGSGPADRHGRGGADRAWALAVLGGGEGPGATPLSASPARPNSVSGTSTSCWRAALFLSRRLPSPCALCPCEPPPCERPSSPSRKSNRGPSTAVPGVSTCLCEVKLPIACRRACSRR